MVKVKPTKGSFIGDTGEREEDVVVTTPIPIPTEKKQKSVKPPEYPRGIKKIASYSGVTRIMKCDGKCGKFDEIVNIYVYPEGIVNNYPDDVIDKYTHEHTISKHNVRNHGYKELSIWGKKEAADGSPYDEISKKWVTAKKGGEAASRHKKKSKPVRRIPVSKRGNAKKHK